MSENLYVRINPTWKLSVINYRVPILPSSAIKFCTFIKKKTEKCSLSEEKEVNTVPAALSKFILFSFAHFEKETKSLL